MQNKLSDLNNHLFAELERLGEEDLSGEELKNEIMRSKAIADIATRVIDNAALVLEGEKARAGAFSADFKLPAMIEG